MSFEPVTVTLAESEESIHLPPELLEIVSRESFLRIHAKVKRAIQGQRRIVITWWLCVLLSIMIGIGVMVVGFITSSIASIAVGIFCTVLNLFSLFFYPTRLEKMVNKSLQTHAFHFIQEHEGKLNWVVTAKFKHVPDLKGTTLTVRRF